MTATAASARGHWVDHPSVAPAAPNPSDLSRLVRRGVALRRFVPPTLPEVATQILDLAERPDVSMMALARLVERDPLLTAQLLRLMQSPAYSRGIKVTSIEQAVGRLGVSALRDMVAQLALKESVYADPAYAEVQDRLRWHGTVVAHLARSTAEIAGIHCEYAYLAGLLHDIGLSVSLLVLSTAYPGSPPPVTRVWPELLRIHEQTGWYLARDWSLPSGLRAALRHHHTIPDEAPDALTSSVVCVADKLASAVGAAVRPFVEHGDEATATSDNEFGAACQRLGLGQAAIDKVYRRAETLLVELKESDDGAAHAQTIRPAADRSFEDTVFVKRG